jgi:hypothetical protein
MEMGQIILGYLIFLVEIFLVLTSLVSVKTTLWAFGVIYAGGVLGMLLCVWWERGELRSLGYEVDD